MQQNGAHLSQGRATVALPVTRVRWPQVHVSPPTEREISTAFPAIHLGRRERERWAGGGRTGWGGPGCMVRLCLHLPTTRTHTHLQVNGFDSCALHLSLSISRSAYLLSFRSSNQMLGRSFFIFPSLLHLLFLSAISCVPSSPASAFSLPHVWRCGAHQSILNIDGQKYQDRVGAEGETGKTRWCNTNGVMKEIEL